MCMHMLHVTCYMLHVLCRPPIVHVHVHVHVHVPPSHYMLHVTCAQHMHM